MLDRVIRALGAVLLGAGLILTVPVPAQADDIGLLRLAHLSPDSPAVDVWVHAAADPQSPTAQPGIGYGIVTDYRELPPGSYVVSLREVGAGPTSPPLLSTSVQVAAGSAQTVAAVGRFADLGLAVLEDDLSPPPPGQARIRVLAAATTPSVDVSVGAVPLATGLAFADAGEPATVPAGTVPVRVRAEGVATEVPVDLAAGSVYSLLVLEGPGGDLALRPVLDAAGATVLPAGGVEAGAGGATGPGRPVVPVAIAGLTALGAAGLFAAWRVRRRSPLPRALGSSAG